MSAASSWRLATDGAARGNPGPAGAGGMLRDPSGRTVEDFAQYLGTLTNNEAEYRALLLGLALARRHQVRELEIQLDSELVVRQLKREYKVKAAHLKPYHERALKELAGFERWSVRHVRREENRDADELANRGVDAGPASMAGGAASKGGGRESSR